MSHDDFAFEPIKGLPEELPEGERILWQGEPRWQNIAKRAFHVRKIALYFVIVMAIQAGMAVQAGTSMGQVFGNAAGTLALAIVAIGIFCTMAFFMSKATVYTITNQRVVMRIGLALSVSINLPFARIESASLRTYADDSGDIPLILEKDYRVSYILLFPHARPWHFSRPQPMLRGIDNAATVANILADALAEKAVGAVNTPATATPDSNDTKTSSQPHASAA